VEEFERIASGIMEQINQAIKRTELVEKPIARLVHFSKELDEIFKDLNDKTDMTEISDETKDMIKALAEVSKKLIVELKNGIGSPDNPLVDEALKRVIDFQMAKILEAMDCIFS
jgi:hypothetical protein